MWFCSSAGCLCGYGRDVVLFFGWFFCSLAYEAYGRRVYLIAAQRSIKKSNFSWSLVGKNPTSNDANWFVRVNASLFFLFFVQKVGVKVSGAKREKHGHRS
jgi:hypothetical protein